MPSEAKHAPLPWTTGTDEDAHVIYDDNLDCVAEVADDVGDSERQTADARFIVTACNAHALLLAFAECHAAMWNRRLPVAETLAILNRHGLADDHIGNAGAFLVALRDRALAAAHGTPAESEVGA